MLISLNTTVRAYFTDAILLDTGACSNIIEMLPVSAEVMNTDQAFQQSFTESLYRTGSLRTTFYRYSSP